MKCKRCGNKITKTAVYCSLCGVRLKQMSNAADYMDHACGALREGKLSQAIEDYKQAIKLDPNYSAAHYYLGLALLNQKRHAEAEAAYRQAIKLDPKDADAVVFPCLRRPRGLSSAYRLPFPFFLWAVPFPS